MRTSFGHYNANFTLATALVMLGAWSESVVAYREALRHDRQAPAFTASNLARALARTGEMEEALSLFQQFPGRPGIQQSQVQVFHAWVVHLEGRLQEAAERARPIASAVAPYPILQSLFDLIQCAAAMERGDATTALEHAEHGLSLRGVLSEVGVSLELHRVRALSQLGRDIEARAVLRRAHDHRLALRDSIEDPAYRENYIDAFSESRELMRLAAEWFGERP
jgi:tetratricopeptide (TPR) repeat protein